MIKTGGAFFGFLMLILASGGTAQAQLEGQASTRASTQSLPSIVTLNLYCQFNDWQWRFAEITRQLKSLRPTVIHFQEVCDRVDETASMSSQIPILLEKSGFKVRGSKAIFTHLAWNDQYRESLLTVVLDSSPTVRRNIEWLGGELPGPGLRRAYLVARFDGWQFINTHLDHEKNSVARPAQLRHLTQWIQSRREHTVLAGDFNSTPDSLEQSPLRASGGTPYFAGPTAPLPGLKKQIDGVWYWPPHPQQTHPRKPHKLAAEAIRVFDQPVSGRYLSDHAGVWARFTPVSL